MTTFTETQWSGFDQAGFEALTPTAFLDRAAAVFGDRVAVVDGSRRFTYAEFADRCSRQAGALLNLGLSAGDRVAVLAPNTSLMLESHYGVPYAGMVLVALNTRLAPRELRYIIDHSGCRALLADPAMEDLARAATTDTAFCQIITAGNAYERMLAGAERVRRPISDERGLISVNYTSGTTGRPKGVMYHHRGAYLQALAMTIHCRLTSDSVYLWTLPMFHCNGWCFTWAVTAVGGTHVCLPRFDASEAWNLIQSEGITHLCAAPTVLTALVNHHDAWLATGRRVMVATGGAPPTPTLIGRSEAIALDITHLYGLTETFGPAVVCDWRSEWDKLPLAERAMQRARQGVGNVVSGPVRVVDDDGRDVPRDGQTIGEVTLRGNNVMLGYYRDPEGTAAAASQAGGFEPATWRCFIVMGTWRSGIGRRT